MMENTLKKVEPIESDCLEKEYDLFVGAVGYERRSRHALEKLQTSGRLLAKVIGVMFAANKILDFETNTQAFVDSGAEIIDIGKLRDTLELALVECEVSEVKCLVDISSMTREQMATIVSCIRDFVSREKIEIVLDFVYSVAKFTEPVGEFGPVGFHGPVLPEFGGIDFDQKLGINLILGLGYEVDIALGVLETMEPDRVIVFVPNGFDPRFHSEVIKANSRLFAGIAHNRVIQYPVYGPVQTFNLLAGLCAGLDDAYRTVLVPFGPKIFSLMCILLNIMSDGRFPVWRVSPLDMTEPRLSEPDGELVCVRTRWFRSELSHGDMKRDL